MQESSTLRVVRSSLAPWTTKQRCVCAWGVCGVGGEGACSLVRSLDLPTSLPALCRAHTRPHFCLTNTINHTLFRLFVSQSTRRLLKQIDEKGNKDMFLVLQGSGTFLWALVGAPDRPLPRVQFLQMIDKAMERLVNARGETVRTHSWRVTCVM
jgi:hypothetical protein